MPIDVKYLKEVYFSFDKPVDYNLRCGVKIYIYPVLLENAAFFNSSYTILDIDKNSSSDPEIISMSYLKFLFTKILPSEEGRGQLYNLCHLCLKMENPYLDFDKNNKPLLIEKDKETNEILFVINQKEFDDIRKIILYQNILEYSDDYISPDMKKAINEKKELLSKGYSLPTMERKIAIITAHTGIINKEQFKMSIRSHELLFKEVVGEVNYQATKAISLYAGKTEAIQWIYPKEKGKFDDYITSVEEYNKSFGGDGKIISTPLEENTKNLIQHFGNL